MTLADRYYVIGPDIDCVVTVADGYRVTNTSGVVDDIAVTVTNRDNITECIYVHHIAVAVTDRYTIVGSLIPTTSPLPLPTVVVFAPKPMFTVSPLPLPTFKVPLCISPYR